MQKESFSEKESLGLIEEMINTAKQEQTGAAFYFILWGIITSIYCIGMFIAVHSRIPELSYSWVVFPIGAVLSILRSKRDDRVEKAKSSYDRLYGYVWGGAGFYMCVVICFGNKLGMNNIVPLIILVYALASFITGGATRYYPSIYGALLCAVCTIFAFNVTLEYQFAICAVSIVCTHIVPGLMMKNYYKRKLNAE